jgi:hypothetical protein
MFPCDKYSQVQPFDETSGASSPTSSKLLDMDFYVTNETLRSALESELEFDKLYLVCTVHHCL